MFYIDGLITKAVNFVTHYDYGLLAAKVVVKTVKFITVNSIEILQKLN